MTGSSPQSAAEDRVARTTRCLASAFLLTLAVVGCGGGDAPAPTGGGAKLGPHGGPVVALPGDKGYAEVISEPVKGAKASLNARVVVYFLKPDLSAPLTPAPEDVSVKLRTPDSPEPIDAPLTPDASGTPAKDAAPATRFASKPGPFAMDRLIGELSAKVDGQPFTGAFASER